MTWTDDDPGQGDPAIIAGLAADLQDQADDAATAARQLRALHDNTTNSVWRGDAADAFRHRIGALPAHLDKLHASYADAAAGMRTYAAAVTQIADDATAAKRLIAAAQADQHTALAQQAAWIAPVNPTTGHPEPAAINPHDETVAAATASVNRATVALNHLGDDRRAADHRVISSLHQAHSAGMKNKSWFHRLLDTASHALAKLTVVLLVIAVVAVVVLAIVQPELIPGLLLLAGQALSGLSAAQLAVDGTRKAMGDNVSWGSLAIDALGALPGAGELAQAGALGEKAIAAAARLSETASALCSSAPTSAGVLFSKGISLSNAEALAGGGGLPFSIDTVTSIAERAGIDLSDIRVYLVREPDEVRYLDAVGAGAYTPMEMGGAEVRFGAAVFANEDLLVATLQHEYTHALQLRQLGPGGAIDMTTVARFEAEAYASEAEALIRYWGRL